MFLYKLVDLLESPLLELAAGLYLEQPLFDLGAGVVLGGAAEL